MNGKKKVWGPFFIAVVNAQFRERGDDERRIKDKCVWLGLLATESRQGV